MFYRCVSVHRGGIPAFIAGASQHALQQVSRGVWYPSIPCRFPGPHPSGKLRGIWPGGSPGPHPRGKLRGIRPRGGLQAHTQRGTCSGGGACSREVPAPGGLLWGGGACSSVETPHDSYCCGQYASFWNALLLMKEVDVFSKGKFLVLWLIYIAGFGLPNLMAT